MKKKNSLNGSACAYIHIGCIWAAIFNSFKFDCRPIKVNIF